MLSRKFYVDAIYTNSNTPCLWLMLLVVFDHRNKLKTKDYIFENRKLYNINLDFIEKQ